MSTAVAAAADAPAGDKAKPDPAAAEAGEESEETEGEETESGEEEEETDSGEEETDEEETDEEEEEGEEGEGGARGDRDARATRAAGGPPAPTVPGARVSVAPKLPMTPEQRAAGASGSVSASIGASSSTMGKQSSSERVERARDPSSAPPPAPPVDLDVPATRVAVSAKGEVFTQYAVAVTPEGSGDAVTVWRRYREFAKLAARLEDEKHRVGVDLPGKTLMRPMRPEIVAERRPKLSAFLKAILADKKARQSPALRAFLRDSKAHRTAVATGDISLSLQYSAERVATGAADGWTTTMRVQIPDAAGGAGGDAGADGKGDGMRFITAHLQVTRVSDAGDIEGMRLRRGGSSMLDTTGLRSDDEASQPRGGSGSEKASSSKKPNKAAAKAAAMASAHLGGDAGAVRALVARGDAKAYAAAARLAAVRRAAAQRRLDVLCQEERSVGDAVKSGAGGNAHDAARRRRELRVEIRELQTTLTPPGDNLQRRLDLIEAELKPAVLAAAQRAWDMVSAHAGGDLNLPAWATALDKAKGGPASGAGSGATGGSEGGAGGAGASASEGAAGDSERKSAAPSAAETLAAIAAARRACDALDAALSAYHDELVGGEWIEEAEKIAAARHPIRVAAAAFSAPGSGSERMVEKQLAGVRAAATHEGKSWRKAWGSKDKEQREAIAARRWSKAAAALVYQRRMVARLIAEARKAAEVARDPAPGAKELLFPTPRKPRASTASDMDDDDDAAAAEAAAAAALAEAQRNAPQTLAASVLMRGEVTKLLEERLSAEAALPATAPLVAEANAAEVAAKAADAARAAGIDPSARKNLRREAKRARALLGSDKDDEIDAGDAAFRAVTEARTAHVSAVRGEAKKRGAWKVRDYHVAATLDAMADEVEAMAL